MIKIFLSHSTKNEELAGLIRAFFESVSSDITVFCSSVIGSIPIGSNFENKIKRELDESDVFIPLLSEDYYKSRYCMIELGFAYSYLSNKFQSSNDEYIMPLLVPPIKKGDALARTPLSFLQVGSIFEKSDVHTLFNVLKESKNIQINAGTNEKINKFIIEAETIVFTKFNFLADSTILTCKANNVHGEARQYISHSQYVDDTSTGYTVNFNMQPFKDNTSEPDFVSFVIKFPGKIDLYQVASIYEDAEIAFDIVNYTDTVRKIDVEIKFSNSLQILKRQTIDLPSGKGSFSIKLSRMRSEALKEISEICFVLLPSYLIESEREGMFQICDIRINANAN